MRKRILSLFLSLTLLIGLTPTVFAADNSFTDVKEGDWFYTPVLWAVENNITGGIGNNRFGPNNPCTRGQVVTFLWAAAGKPEPTMVYNPFSDVSASDYYYKAVIWAVQEGITGGLTSTTFGPNEICTRAQVVTFLWAAAKKPAPASASTAFTDVREADWFYMPVLWAVENGITSGLTSTTFGAYNQCTRGQIVTFLYAARNVTADPTPPPADEEKQKEFEAKTIYDFPEHLVINFDDDPETNFGVLNENVIRWENEPITAERYVSGEQTKYVFSDEEALKDIPLGSVVYVLSPAGAPYLVSFGSVEGNVVTTDPDTPMSDFYTYLDAAIVTTIDTAAMAPMPTDEVTAVDLAPAHEDSGQVNNIVFEPSFENGVTLGSNFSSEYYELGITGSLTCETDGHIKYDPQILGRDYIDFLMESTVTLSADAVGTLKASNKLGSINKDLELGEVPLAPIVPGLNLTMEVKLPVQLDAKVSFTGNFSVSRTERIEYKNTYEKPIHTSVEEDEDGGHFDTNCKGEVVLKAGVSMEIGADFLDDKLELVLELKLMGGIRGIPENPSQSTYGNPTSVHMCSLCIKGELFAELSGEIKFQANISEKTKLELITIPLLKLEIPLNAFYVSMESPTDSVHKGEVTFGFGSCPNYKWRIDWVLKNHDGSSITKLHQILLTYADGSNSYLCRSDKPQYLYDGSYTAALQQDEEYGPTVSFRVRGFADDIILTPPEPAPEKEVYTAYLLNGGYEEVVYPQHFDDDSEWNSISTTLIDLDGNGIQELLIRCTNLLWGGNAGYRPDYTALYTIDKDTEEVVCIGQFQKGNPYPNGASSLSFMKDSNTGEHSLVLYTHTYFDDKGANETTVYTIQSFDGQKLVSGDSYRIEEFRYPYTDEQFADEIENIKKGPHTISEYWQTITAYYLNDVQVTKEEYDSAFALTSKLTDSAYTSYGGSYNNPIQ